MGGPGDGPGGGKWVASGVSGEGVMEAVQELKVDSRGGRRSLCGGGWAKVAEKVEYPLGARDPEVEIGRSRLTSEGTRILDIKKSRG